MLYAILDLRLSQREQHQHNYSVNHSLGSQSSRPNGRQLYSTKSATFAVDRRNWYARNRGLPLGSHLRAACADRATGAECRVVGRLGQLLQPVEAFGDELVG
jgi:hypothetical protein